MAPITCRVSYWLFLYLRWFKWKDSRGDIVEEKNQPTKQKNPQQNRYETKQSENKVAYSFFRPEIMHIVH